MIRILPICGLLAVASGVAWIIPVVAASLAGRTFDARDYTIASVGPIVILAGMFVLSRSLRGLRSISIPAAVRAVIVANGLFLAFCALEFSDRLLLRGGRVFYWTSVLFIPALVLFYGQVSARRWAWWTTRIMAVFSTLWFVGFLMLIPFVQLQGGGVKGDGSDAGGRLWAAGLTVVFASISAYVSWSLGRAEARNFYGLSHQPPIAKGLERTESRI